jgi:hypothetical protein
LNGIRACLSINEATDISFLLLGLVSPDEKVEYIIFDTVSDNQISYHGILIDGNAVDFI